jgi:hypothetical protein
VPLIVHGLLGADTARELNVGLLRAPADEPVDLVTHRDLAGLVEHTDDDEVLPSRANLLTHTRILEAVAERTTVLPMQFGVVVPDAQTLVATYLGPEHDDIVARLERLAGHVELRLRGRYDEEAVLRDVLASDRRAVRLRGRTGFAARMELGERVVAGIEARRDRDAAHTVEALRPHATDVAAGRVAEPLDAFSASFLVDRGRIQDFDRAVDHLADDLSPLVHLELVGPLPPFSFMADGGR